MSLKFHVTAHSVLHVLHCNGDICALFVWDLMIYNNILVHVAFLHNIKGTVDSFEPVEEFLVMSSIV